MSIKCKATAKSKPKKSARRYFAEPVAVYDCDDTLIFWSTPIGYPGPAVEINEINAYGNSVVSGRFAVNTVLVDDLKARRRRGHTVVVWSQGGGPWARAVVKALKLGAYVDIIMSKPSWVFDDIDPSVWFPSPDLPLPPNWKGHCKGPLGERVLPIYYPPAPEKTG